MNKKNKMVDRVLNFLLSKPKGAEAEVERAAEFLAGLKSFSKYKRLFKGIVGAWNRKDFGKGRIVQYPIKLQNRFRSRGARRERMQDFWCKPQWGRPSEHYEESLNALHNRMNPNTGWG